MSTPDQLITKIKKGDLTGLNTLLLTNSFIDGFVATKKDLTIFAAVPNTVDASKYPNVARWYYYVAAIPFHVRSSLPEDAATYFAQFESSSSSSSSGSSSSGSSSSGSESEESRLAREKKEAYDAKTKRNVEKEQSNLIIDVSFVEFDDASIADTEAKIRAITLNVENPADLVWAVKFETIPLAFGVKKLRIANTIRNVAVSVDDLQDAIEDLENVSSTEVVAFQKI
eukprot:TRINITY_DN50777_c0_g1_i1.p1 TRINITY_DN50777_c0_g1~~TRINITY_DN50777_c0_g1_i1.p1  ORF type:complete len:227 (+),score=26.74 TRINITY_DN50777_c0_g1_i1:33-713(+)